MFRYLWLNCYISQIYADEIVHILIYSYSIFTKNNIILKDTIILDKKNRSKNINIWIFYPKYIHAQLICSYLIKIIYNSLSYIIILYYIYNV